MRNRHSLGRMRVALSIATLALVLGSCSWAGAQESSLSDPLSPNLSIPETQNDGFDSSFEPAAEGFTNNDIHSDVQDPTHSQLTGSALTPMTGASVQSYSYASINTGVMTDSQMVVGQSDFNFGGKRSQLFSPGSSIPSASASRLSAMETLGSGSAEAAFNGTAGSRLSETSQSGTGTAGRSFSGEGATVPKVEQGAGPKQFLSSTGAPVAEGAYVATDPVLTGSTSGYETESQLGGTAPPTTQVEQTFADQITPESRFQYDDGQTPALTSDPKPGSVGTGAGAVIEYTPSPSGFPDSTRGLAGLPSQQSLDISPFPSLSSGSLFSPPAVSEGTVFGLKVTLNPTLHPVETAVAAPSIGLLIASERRAEMQRVASGMALSDSAALYRQAIEGYRRARGGRRPRTLEELDSPNRQTSRSDLVPQRTIR